MSPSDPFSLNDPAVVSGPESPYSGGENTYNFTAVDQAEAYEARIAEAASGSWLEGAEASPTPEIIDGTDAGYSLISSYTAASGSNAFHLTFPSFSSQNFEIDRNIIAQSGSQVSFKYRRFFMHFSTKLRIELSDNDGASYTTIGTIDGTNPSGTSTDWDSNFITTSIAIPAAFLDTSIRLRFRLDATGSTFLGSEDNRGIYIDDIAVSNSIQLLSPSVIALDSGTTSFGLTPSTPGEQYFLQVRPKLGDHWFGYGDPLAVAAVSPPPAPFVTSSATATGEQGEAFSYSIVGTNSPTSYGATGLPAGADVNTATGAITGSIAPDSYGGITISATNAGGTGIAPLTIIIQTGYEAEVANNYPGLGAPEEDDDQDSIPNLVELAITGMSPTTQDAHLLPSAILSGGNIILTINKSGLVGVDYSIEGSSTLLSGSWNDDDLVVIADNATTLQVSYPISAALEHFLRLVVAQNTDTTTEP